jgi:hypothetical protein
MSRNNGNNINTTNVKNENIKQFKNVLPRKLEKELNNSLRLFPKEYKLLVKINQVLFLKLEQSKNNNKNVKSNNNKNVKSNNNKNVKSNNNKNVKSNNNKNVKSKLVGEIYRNQYRMNQIIDVNIMYDELVMKKGLTLENMKKYLKRVEKDVSNNNKEKLQNNNVIRNVSGNIKRYSTLQNNII